MYPEASIGQVRDSGFAGAFKPPSITFLTAFGGSSHSVDDPEEKLSLRALAKKCFGYAKTSSSKTIDSESFISARTGDSKLECGNSVSAGRNLKGPCVS